MSFGVCGNAAISAIEGGLRPIPLRSGSKRPLNTDWGSVRHTQESIKTIYKQHPNCGLGLYLGDLGDGLGIVDFEIDDPKKADSTIRRIWKGGSVPPTLRFHSNRGWHYLFLYDHRLAMIGESVVKGPHYPGVEVLVGTTDPTRPVSLQVVIPPTPRDDGEPRVFFSPDGGVISPTDALRNWRELVSPFPDELYRDIEQFVGGIVDSDDGSPVWDADQVKEAILSSGKLVGLLNEWGLRLTSDQPNSAGWLECRAIGREDNDPSARVCAETGVYLDFGTDRTLSLISLSVELGAYPNFPEAVNSLGKMLGIPPVRKVKKVSVPDPVNNVTTLEAWSPPVEVDALDVPPYPVEVFHPRLQEFIRCGSEAYDCPPDFIATAMLGVAGGTIGNAVHLEVNTGYHQPPHLTVTFIAPPGRRKSAANALVVDPLYHIDAETRAKYLEALDKWESNKEESDGEGSKPILRQRVVGSDSTKEAIAKFLSDNPRGGVMPHDELASWVANLNAYRGGKGDDRQFFLSVNSGATIKVNRKSHDVPLILRRPSLSIVGPLTPSMLPSLRGGSVDDGWFDRIVVSYPPSPPLGAWNDKEMPETVKSIWNLVLRRLDALECDLSASGEITPRLVRMTRGAEVVYRSWFNALRREANSDHTLQGPWSKMEGYCLRFALILGMLDAAVSDISSPLVVEGSVVDTDTMERAVTLAEYHKAHARKVRQELVGGTSMNSERGKAVLRTIARGIDQHQRGELTTLSKQLGQQTDPYRIVTLRIIRLYHKWETSEIEGAIDWLHQSGHLQTLSSRGGGRGRPASIKYAVNPLWNWREHVEG